MQIGPDLANGAADHPPSDLTEPGTIKIPQIDDIGGHPNILAPSASFLLNDAHHAAVTRARGRLIIRGFVNLRLTARRLHSPLSLRPVRVCVDEMEYLNNFPALLFLVTFAIFLAGCVRHMSYGNRDDDVGFCNFVLIQ